MPSPKTRAPEQIAAPEGELPAFLNGANGSTPETVPVGQPVTIGPIVPRREVWISFPREYEGFKFRAWINHPRTLIDQLRYGELAEQTAAIGKIVLEHNGWRDEDGNPYPPASDTGAFWEAIPDEMALLVISLIEAEKRKLPNLARVNNLS